MDPCPRPISTRVVILPDTAERRTLFVFCPRLVRAVPLEDGCADCTACAGFTTGQDPSRRPSALCTFGGCAEQASPCAVGAVLARHAVCVRADAVGVVRGVSLHFGNVAVVDDETHLVGTLDPTGHLHACDHGRGTAIPEETPVPRALRQMAAQRWRSAPVIARDGTVVGVVDDVDALRALTVRAAL
jgi:hypothetical protein